MDNGMSSVEELWAVYGRERRPANIGDRVAGMLLGELDDEVQDIVSSYMGMGMGEEVDALRVARLGLALAEITRVLPEIQPTATREYFQRLADLARAALAAIADREA
jgi:hypothetical protein